MMEAIKTAYDTFESLNISTTGLIVIALVLVLAFLFALREAASWFLKVDDLKKDLRRLRASTEQMETEIRNLQSLVAQSKQASLNLVPPFEAEPSAAAKSDSPSAASKSASAQFPIVR